MLQSILSTPSGVRVVGRQMTAGQWQGELLRYRAEHFTVPTEWMEGAKL